MKSFFTQDGESSCRVTLMNLNTTCKMNYITSSLRFLWTQERPDRLSTRSIRVNLDSLRQERKMYGLCDQNGPALNCVYSIAGRTKWNYTTQIEINVVVLFYLRPFPEYFIFEWLSSHVMVIYNMTLYTVTRKLIPWVLYNIYLCMQ